MYEQTELDMRTQLAQKLAVIVVDAVDAARNAVNSTQPSFVRNRHEAYGIAAEHYGKAAGGLKEVKDSMAKLLTTLADPAAPAVEAVSSLCNSSETLATEALLLAAEMHRVLDNLFISEEGGEGKDSEESNVIDFQGADFAPAEDMEE